jgi:hypothetical protein
MRRSIQAGALGFVLGMAAVARTRGVKPQEGRGVLAGLKVGQPVTLQDLGSAYVIRVLDVDVPTGEEVAEMGDDDDYLVVKTHVGVETRIPVTSIKAVIQVLIRWRLGELSHRAQAASPWSLLRASSGEGRLAFRLILVRYATHFQPIGCRSTHDDLIGVSYGQDYPGRQVTGFERGTRSSVWRPGRGQLSKD